MFQKLAEANPHYFSDLLKLYGVYDSSDQNNDIA